MQSSLSQRVQRYIQEHLHERHWRRVVTVLACIVVFCTTYALVLPALTLTGGTFCGKEAHCHSDECYEKALICGLEERATAAGTSAHTHADECYEVQQILSCGREESAGHTHDEPCYGEGGEPVCGQEESEGHTHTEACYQEAPVLVCTEPTDTVTEGHVHTDACYEKTLICQKEEHAHSLQCYSDPDAVETPEEWEQGLPAGTGDAAKDLAAVAQSQLGYAESTVNYLVGADGETVHGYTRYGAWHGQPYAADWSALFASFCLHYANVPETAFPRGDSCESWMTELQAMERYQPSDSYSHKPGDVAFLDLDADGAADHAGIVLEEDAAAVGDVDGEVAETPLDTALGYGVLPTDAPKKAPAARSGGDVRPEITVKTGPSSDGSMTFYTGQAATTTLSISNPESAQIEADDGTVIRLYMQFDKTNPGTGHPESADGTPSQQEGTYTVKATGSEHAYQYTVTRINGADADHYTYCLEIQRPLQGDTISLNLPSDYPSPTSAGGTNTVWGVVLTQGEKEELDKTGTNGKPGIPPKPEDGTNTQTITWTTKPNTFNLNKKCNDSDGRIVSDGKGGYTIQDLKYYIHAARDTAQTLEGVGKDHVTSVTCVDTFTLPEGVRFAQNFIDAVKNKTYDTTYVWQKGKMKVSDSTGTGIVIGGFPFGSDKNTTALSLSEDNRTLSITWTSPNNDSWGRPIINKEITDLNRNISFDKGILLIDQLKSTEPYRFTNNVEYTFHYSWSGDQAVDADCVAERTAGKAELTMKKSILSKKIGYFGEGIRYQIKLKNEGTLPYEKLCYVDDPLPEHMYLSAGNLAALFNDGEYGKDASVSIAGATFCPANPSRTVTCADGTTSAATAARNTSVVSATKYSGCSTGTQHREDHTGSIDIRWNADHTHLVLTVKKADGNEEIQTCAATANGIQSVLDQLGYVVTGYTCSTIVWDLRDDAGQPVPIYGGAEIAIEFSASLMDTFMRLERDVPGFYPNEEGTVGNNRAYAHGDEGPDGRPLADGTAHSGGLSREFYLDKSARLANFSHMTEKNVPGDGETVEYSLSVRHLGSAEYDILPLTDRMSGAQVLLAEQGKNSGASWAKDCEPYTAEDGTAYYKLSHGGVYSGVWLGDQYADSVTVTESASGRDTLIKWYFANYGGYQTGNVSYKALVCPMELNIKDLSYSLDNESWLGDHETHRLYVSLLGIKGTLLEFDKKIVPESDISAGNDAKVDGEDYCPIVEGQTVYYRFRLKAIAPEAGEEPRTVTITGSQLRDSLPLELKGILNSGHTGGADEQNPLPPGLNFQWKKVTGNAAEAQPGDVWIVGYQNQTKIQNGDSWRIQDTGTENQREILWDDNFSVSFTSDAPLYIYVRLTFPKGDAWQEYAAKYSFTELVNTFYVDGIPSSVRHDLKIAAGAILQKGVASVQSYSRSYSSADPVRPTAADSLFYYENDSAALQTVLYYAVLYNGGSTRLYIGDMQDILPEGFTFGRMVYGDDYHYAPDNPYPPDDTTLKPFFGVLSDNPSYLCAKENGSSPRVKWKSGRVKADVFRSRITFRIDREEETDTSVRYDAERRKYYLNPGEGISFGYLCRTNEYAQTPDVAVNSIAMPYFDYTGGGVEISEGTAFTTRLGPAAWQGNDGSCEIIDNAQAVASGRSGVSNDTQWLYSQVQQQRGTIKPGITKKLTAAVSQTGTVTNDPIAAHPSDTLRWAVTAVNDGESPITDYVLTDTMQAPYRFDGDVCYTVSRSDGEDVSLGINKFFSISTASDGLSAKVQTNVEMKPVKVNGDPVNIRVNRDIRIAVRLTQDEKTGNYTLSIRFPDAYWGIPAGGTGVLTLETKRADNTLENKVFVNTCFLTPMAQSWDNTTNRGNVTVLDGVFGKDGMPSVRNSAPVTTAYGFVTSSRKSVAEKGKPGNTAACDATPNYIVLPGTDSLFTYTLTVDAPEERAMDKLIFIDGLPAPNDHSSFQNDDPRYSEFKVAFADDPNVTVTVTTKNGSVSTLRADQFKVEYSTKTEFDADDWKGSSRWNGSSTDARSLRVTILDSSGALIPARSHVSVRFDAKIAGEAQSGQTAWNSFGYHYSVDFNELEAAPLKCGVMLPIIPEIVKQVVDRSGDPARVKSTKTFRFLVYTGASLKETNEAALAEALRDDCREAALIELTVAAGRSKSDRRKLDDLRVCTYADGQWVETHEDWVWESGARYTLVELPDDDPSCKFSSINHITAADGYTFNYQNDRTLVLSAVNLLDLWSFTIRKTNAYDGSALTGAWFALYSPDARDSISEAAYNALTEKPTQKSEFTLTIGEGAAGKTWYLTRVGQTRNMAGKEGTLTWDGLLREEYRYREIQAPMGYRLDDTIRTVRKSDAVHAIAIPNTGSGVRLPETGGMGTFCFTAGGVLLLTAGLLGYGWKRKRERG
jgi:LPXTG-motif cell wall-anchored protein